MGESAAIAGAPSATSVASLLTGHVLRDGELILLTLKPSRWYIVLSSLRFAAAVSLIVCALQLSHAPQTAMRYYVDAGVFAVACRVMWAVLNWMGRLYVLTDQRILRLSGVFKIDIFDCPLRKVAMTRIVRLLPERLLRLGTIEILPSDESRAASAWQTISRAAEVHAQMEAAIRKAKQGGFGACAA